MNALNGISKINELGGDYIVLTDYGSEGISVTHQADDVKSGIEWILKNADGSPHSLVKLVWIDAKESTGDEE